MTSTFGRPSLTQVPADFPRSWQVERLAAPPMIRPARHFTLPRPVPGEEEAIARGALELLITPAVGSPFLATCALGFQSPSVPTGLWTCPGPDHLCAIAGGYAYLIDTLHPETTVQVPLRPVTAVRSVPEHNLILFAGFHNVIAWGPHGQRWASARLSWEGLSLGEIHDGQLQGTGWDLHTDRELPFTLDLITGAHQGGGFVR